jgi:cytochrome c553
MLFNYLFKVLQVMKAKNQLALSALLFLALLNAQAADQSSEQTTEQTIEKITIKLDFIPNIEDGRTTFSVCARCHLPEAWGNIDGTYPQLAGQHVNVLMKQLLDIRSGRRQSALMHPFVQQRTVGGYQELSNVVAYISTLPMNPDHGKGPWREGSDEYSQGLKVYQQYCSSCHGKNGEGNNELVYPKLQGQNFQYLSQQLMRIKSGVREVHHAMTAIVQGLDYEQLEKAANYASYFAVPKEDMANSKAWRNPDFN